MRTALIAGGWSHESQLNAAPAIEKSLQRLQHEVLVMDGANVNLAGRLLEANVDVVFSAATAITTRMGGCKAFAIGWTFHIQGLATRLPQFA